MIRRFPLAAATLALSLTTSASIAAEGSQLGQDDEQLKSALAGAPVIVTLQVASVTLTSSADAMFPSGGWQILSDAQQNVADILQITEYVDCCGRIHGQCAGRAGASGGRDFEQPRFVRQTSR